MGMTNEPRKAVEVPVRVFGTDCDGRPFYEHLTTVDVSLHQAKSRGLKAKLRLDEIVGLTYGKNKGHFRVKWIGTPGTATEGVVGLLNLNPAKRRAPALAAGEVLGFGRTARQRAGGDLGQSLGP
jgi:hypothetical protein